MKYVVTGGAGFIGSHLADELSNDHGVVIVDDLSSGREENIEALVEKEQVTFLEGSVLDGDLVREACEGADGIFHLAAQVSVFDSVADPVTTNEINVKGTLNVLLAAADAGVRKVVYASSAAVYGDNPIIPKHEEMMPEPLSPYAVTKVAGEHYCHVFSHLYGVETVSLRFFNVFGPRQDPSSAYAAVIPAFIERFMKSQPPVIYGDGEQTRDFVYVGDVARAAVMAMESDATGVYNIARGERISLNELVHELMVITETDIAPRHEAARAGDIRHSLADTTRAKETFGFAPVYSLEEGLKATVAWFFRE
jgi:nucleoside-diphosphate-sugar epimerase